MTAFLDALHASPVLLTNGGVMARIMTRPDLELDPSILHATAVFDEGARPVLADVYAGYVAVAARHRLPIMCSTPTLRANAERARRSPYGDARSVNRACVEFLDETASRLADWREHVYLAGSVGPGGDTYSPETALPTRDAARFHVDQAEALAEAGVDILVGYTLPAFTEAAGMAEAFADVELPYALSFVLDRKGCLLDGTPLELAIAAIDDSVKRPPSFYLTNCSHSSAIRAGLARVSREAPDTLARLAGARPNASPKDHTELEGLDHIETESPEDFTRALIALREDYERGCDLKVLGGCCGTDETHLEALAAAVSA